ncbi:MAG: phosphoenolpyruvate carboxykinase (ATP), partial [Planctomycetota bacterium]
RAVVHAALTGALDDIPCHSDPIFKVEVPEQCPNVPDELLQPRATWADKEAYDAKARELAARFAENFKDFEEQAAPEVRAAAPGD